MEPLEPIPCEEQGFMSETMQSDFPECADPLSPWLAGGAIGCAALSLACCVVLVTRRAARQGKDQQRGQRYEPPVF